VKLTFLKRDPEKGYLGRQLWLPKKHINTRSVKAGLEFPIMDATGITYLQLWEDSQDHLIVPREFIPRKEFDRLKFEIVLSHVHDFDKVRFTSRIVLDKKKPESPRQKKAFASMHKADSGILNLACVAGSTVIGLNRGGKGFSTTIKNAYDRSNDERYMWNKTIPTMIRSNVDGRIRLNKVEAIIHKGKRLTYTLKLADGKSLRLTSDHEVMTTRGWVPLQDVQTTDEVIVDTATKHMHRHNDDRVDNLGYGLPTPVRVHSVTKHKVEDVYDVVCADPHHNFVANGMVVHNCGVGKTVIALEHIAQSGVPALVVVNNTTLISQWKERIETFLDVEGGVGVVQGNPRTWDWRGRGIVLAMIHTLSLRYEELPVGFDRYFGGVYYDEVHHLSAPLFVKTAPMFYGKRFGLTATAEREDGLEGVYMYHIGGIFHRDLMPELKPRIYFQAHPLHIRESDAEVRREICDKTGQVNIPKYRGYLGRLVENNEFIAHKVSEPLKVGRKVLVLSHSKDQLKLLHQMFPDSGLCTGDEEPDARMKVLREKPLTFGTLQLVKEALDEQTLDTIFFLTAFGSSAVEGGGKGTLQQGMGRILREMSGKKTPVVIIMDYVNIPKFHKMCRRMKTLLHEWPVDQGGPYEYEILRPYTKNGTEK